MSAITNISTGRAFARLVFSDAVKATQTRYGVRERTAMLETEAAPNDVLTDVPRAFLETCDSFVIASAGRNLWPHVQHRGGPRGFLKCLDDRTLAFGDFDGNRQFLTLGNVAENPRVMLLLIDRKTRRRLKIWAEAEVIDDDAALLARLDDPAYPARPKRAVVLHVHAWDINCPKHIPRLYTEDEVREAISALHAS
jgi:predicted pyridoxine 5'-phosphate oxidase superfamily flavin-nucleotide-binding protein